MAGAPARDARGRRPARLRRPAARADRRFRERRGVLSARLHADRDECRFAIDVQPRIDRVRSRPPYTPLWHQLVDAAEAADAAAIATARQARAADPARADWGVVYQPPAVAILLPHLNHTRNLANLLVDTAERSILRGDAAEGVERFRDVLHLARTVYGRQPTLVEMLVAGGISALVYSKLGLHVATLDIGTGPRQATPAQVRDLIAELLATADLLADGSAYETEASFGSDYVEELAVGMWLTRPLVRLERPRLARLSLDALAISRTGDHRGRPAEKPAARGFSQAANFRPNALDQRMSRPIVNEFDPDGSNRRILVTESRIVTSARAAAIAVAARLYEHEHGRPARSIDALIPDLLPRLPPNPLPGDGTPFRIRVLPGGLPDGRDRVLLDVLATEKVPPEPKTIVWPLSSVDLVAWPAPATAPAAP